MTFKFSQYRNKFIPVIEWKFFSSLKEGKTAFNQMTWTDWKEEWVPIATNIHGDPIILFQNAIYDLNHDMDSDQPDLITKDLGALSVLLKKLQKISYSDEDTAEALRKVKKEVIALKKTAPSRLKYDFQLTGEELTDFIKDANPNKKKEKKVLKEMGDYIARLKIFLAKTGKYKHAYVYRKSGKSILLIQADLEGDETEEEFMRLIEESTPPYPVEYLEFTRI